MVDLHSLSPRRLHRAACALFLGFALSLLALPAFADYAGTKTYKVRYSCFAAQATPAAACMHFLSTGGCVINNPQTWSYGSNTDTTCYLKNGSQTNDYPIDIGNYTCPYGGSYVGNGMCSGTPTCPAGQVYNTSTSQCAVPDCPSGEIRNPISQQCEKDCSSVSGRTSGSSNNYAILSVADPSSYNGNSDFCVEGCAAKASGGVKCHWSNQTGSSGDRISIGGHCEGQGPFNFNGRSCASYSGGISDLGSVETDPAKPWYDSGKNANECAKSGGSWGHVNQIETCIKPGAGNTNVQNNGKDTGTANVKTVPDGAGGTTKTTETTSHECKDGKCTSTSITVIGGQNSNGTAKTETTTTKTEEQPQQEFCKKNPSATGCVNAPTASGSWGGGCGGFQCSGDAAQCAIAREIHQRNCEASASNAYTDLVDAAGAGTDNGSTYIQAQKDATPISAQAKFSENLQSSPIAASCPSPRSVGLPGGHSFEISFEKPCEFAGYLGYFVQAFAYLTAALIVLRNPTA